MSKVKLFISFRFSDGKDLKDNVEEKLIDLGLIISKSEDTDRSDLSDKTIQKYLYEKLADSSVTIGIITKNGKDYNVNKGKYEDWLYDEIRYSLEDREGNKPNGVIALYDDDVEGDIIKTMEHSCTDCGTTKETIGINQFDNLLRKNMLNVKANFKKCGCDGVYNEMDDSYVSLVHVDEFLNNPQKYIDNAIEKRDRITQFEIVKRLQNEN